MSAVPPVLAAQFFGPGCGSPATNVANSG